MRESQLGSSILFHTDLAISFPKKLPRLKHCPNLGLLVVFLVHYHIYKPNSLALSPYCRRSHKLYGIIKYRFNYSVHIDSAGTLFRTVYTSMVSVRVRVLSGARGLLIGFCMSVTSEGLYKHSFALQVISL